MKPFMVISRLPPFFALLIGLSLLGSLATGCAKKEAVRENTAKLNIVAAENFYGGWRGRSAEIR